MKSSSAFRIAAVVLLSATCVIGAWVLKGSQARSLPEAVPVVPQYAPSSTENVVKTEPETPPAALPQSVEVAEPPVELPPVANVKSNTPRKMYSLTRQSAPPSIGNNARGDVQIVETKEEPAVAAPPVVASPKVEPPKPIRTTNNSQPVAPARSTPPKAKVIQWP